MDLEALVTDELREEVPATRWSGSRSRLLARPPHARVSVTLPEGGSATGSFTGDGPIDAVFQAINAATASRRSSASSRSARSPRARTPSARCPSWSR